ncbi:MAG: PPOX class F420-dependent oxidoreductase [Ilumatobacteraceae bacterium]
MTSPLNNKEKYVSLVTFRRDGSPVATPVWFAAMGNEFGVITETNVGKVKRIRNDQRVTVQVCDYSGDVVPAGDPTVQPVLKATARLVTGDEAVAVRKAISKKYGLTYATFALYWNVSNLLAKLRGRSDDSPETAILFTLN